MKEAVPAHRQGHEELQAEKTLSWALSALPLETVSANAGCDVRHPLVKRAVHCKRDSLPLILSPPPSAWLPLSRSVQILSEEKKIMLDLQDQSSYDWQ